MARSTKGQPRGPRGRYKRKYTAAELESAIDRWHSMQEEAGAPPLWEDLIRYLGISRDTWDSYANYKPPKGRYTHNTARKEPGAGATPTPAIDTDIPIDTIDTDTTDNTDDTSNTNGLREPAQSAQQAAQQAIDIERAETARLLKNEELRLASGIIRAAYGNPKIQALSMFLLKQRHYGGYTDAPQPNQAADVTINISGCGKGAAD